jgi:hypothetical protein
MPLGESRNFVCVGTWGLAWLLGLGRLCGALEPVRFDISLIESLSRNFMRLTLPIMSMVITLSLLLQNAAGQLNTLVNFESALPCLGGQFSVGANSLGEKAVSRVIVDIMTEQVSPASLHMPPALRSRL